MQKIKDILQTIREYLSDNPKVIGLGITAVIAVALFGAVVYVQSSPAYSLYKMHKAVASNNVAEFDKYWDVKAIMAAPKAAGNEDGVDQMSAIEALKTYKDKYYYPLSLKAALFDTDIRKEAISDGALVFTYPPDHETAMRMERNQGHYVVTEFAELK